MPKHASHILELAKRGAEVRFRELRDEMKFLTLSFPHLKDAVDNDDLPLTFILRKGRDKAIRAASARKKPTISAAGREAIEDAQRKRWPKLKATKKV
jgi:hypothetical protein